MITNSPEIAKGYRRLVEMPLGALGDANSAERRSFAPVKSMVRTGSTVANKTNNGNGFGERLHAAMDAHAQAPRERFGRLTWLMRELAKHDIKVTIEAVRRWAADESIPRPATVNAIAQILQTDVAWLTLGATQEVTPRERRARNAAADGAVNLVTGLIQLGGGTPAFPEADDKRSKGVDVFAIIKGAQYSFKIVMATPVGDSLNFAVPVDHERFFVLGVIHVGDLHYDVVELSQEAIESAGVRKGGSFDVQVERGASGYRTRDVALRQIKDFSARL